MKTTIFTVLIGMFLLLSSAPEAGAQDWRLTGNAGTNPNIHFLGTQDATNLVFRTNNVERMRLYTNGRLRIRGNQAGDATLNGGGALLIGSTSSANLIFDNNEIMARNNGNRSTLLLNHNGGMVHIGGSTSSSSHDASLSSGGRLQLGPTSGANLALDGNEIIARNNGNAAPLFLNATGGSIYVGSNSANADDVALNGGGRLILGRTNTRNLALDNNEIMARNNGNAAVLHLQNQGGQVAIGAQGIDLPDEYVFFVDGAAMAEEVRVALSGNWGDFVFDEAYALPSLEEVRQYIAAHRHLPGMPAAAEIEANGLHLGEMQRRTVIKVEELYLYTIELQSRYDELQAEVAALKQAVEKLK